MHHRADVVRVERRRRRLLVDRRRRDGKRGRRSRRERRSRDGRCDRRRRSQRSRCRSEGRRAHHPAGRHETAHAELGALDCARHGPRDACGPRNACRRCRWSDRAPRRRGRGRRTSHRLEGDGRSLVPIGHGPSAGSGRRRNRERLGARRRRSGCHRPPCGGRWRHGPRGSTLRHREEGLEIGRGSNARRTATVVVVIKRRRRLTLRRRGAARGSFRGSFRGFACGACRDCHDVGRELAHHRGVLVAQPSAPVAAAVVFLERSQRRRRGVVEPSLELLPHDGRVREAPPRIGRKGRGE